MKKYTLVLYSKGNLSQAKLKYQTTNNNEILYVNTTHDRDCSKILGLIFDNIIFIDDNVAPHYKVFAESRLKVIYQGTNGLL